MNLNFLNTKTFDNFLFACALAQITKEDKILLNESENNQILSSACYLNNCYISYNETICIEDNFDETNSIYYPDIYKQLSLKDKQTIHSFISDISNHKDILKHLPIIENIPLDIITPYLPSVLDDEYAFIWRYGQKFIGETVNDSFEDGRLIVPDREIIQKYYDIKEFPDKLLTPNEWPLLSKEDAIKYHHQRIAQLAHNLPNDPITITKDWDGIAISDGYHRYCSYIFKNIQNIPIKYNQNLMQYMNHIKSEHYENDFLNILSQKTNMPIVCYTDEENEIKIKGVTFNDFFITAKSTISLDNNTAHSYFVDVYDCIDTNVFNTIPTIIQLPSDLNKYEEALKLVNCRLNNIQNLLKNQEPNLNNIAQNFNPASVSL